MLYSQISTRISIILSETRMYSKACLHKITHLQRSMGRYLSQLSLEEVVKVLGVCRLMRCVCVGSWLVRWAEWLTPAALPPAS